MEISYLINEIRKNIDGIKDYNVFVIRENPKLKDDFMELPIKDLEIDEDGEEINIILYDDTNKQNKTINVESLLEKLEKYIPNGSSYHLFVRHPKTNLGKIYFAYLDVPVTAHGISEDGNSFGLLEVNSTSKNT